MDALASVPARKGLRLDPRTKLLLLLTVTTLMFSTGNTGVMNVVKPVLSVLPFLLLLSEGRWRTALKYLGLYAVCFVLERLALHVLTGLPAFLLLTLTSIMTRFAPGIMVGAFLVASTSVSDFLAAMKRMRVSEKILIPLSVIFRFLPTIGEENAAIRDAMRMRGIRFGGKHPGRMLEYRLVPLMISIVKIGDELSAAALTRGLGAPGKRTDLCEIGFHWQDVLLIALCLAAFAVTFGSRWLA